MLYRNKVGLRQLMKNIYKYNVDGVLVVFVQEKKWRLSYISEIIKEIDEKGKIIKEITNEKRFTYLLGEGEKTKTATDRLQLLVRKELSLEDFKNAFAVEALNNDFFDRYKDIYEDFVQHITGVRYEKKGNKYIENKKHQPHPNFDGYKDYKDYPMPHPDSETKLFKNREFQNLFRGNEKAVRDFVKRMMGRIVFLYFIQKKGWLAVPKGKNWGEGNYDYLYQLYKETPREDQPYFYEKRLAPLFFECFTDKKSESETNDLRFPYLNGGLFDKTQDQHFDKVNLPYSIFTELFDTFNSYNFTVYEDAPNEHTIAVDPEMLGHIFENLLEDNKDKGAFYTPKEIVHYMCKESLKTFLLSKITPNGQSEEVKDVITKIIEHQPLNEEEKNYVKEKGDVITTSLENVKICDPAIGSGAFPMGLLQEIYYIKITLQQSGITTEQTDAQIKKHIIEQNIYGVDIDAGAVDIARLRFWLSLVVDEQLPQPLPNLDFKIMQGNSLLESYQGVDLSELTKVKSEKEAGAQITIFDEMLDVHRNDLSSYIKRYFSCTNSKEKITIRKEIDKNIRQQINQSYPKIDMTNIDICANPYFFLWHTYFTDVFKGANNLDNSGFDIVIGNPPYGAKLSQEDKEILKKKYISAQTIKGVQKGSLDTYTLFIELGYNLLKKGGNLGFIVPISITSSEAVTGIHKLLSNNCSAIKLSSYAVRPKPVFENAMVNTSIIQFVKTNTSCESILSTKMYRRGKNFNLEQLINNLEFVETKDLMLLGRIPKISYNIERNILTKILNQKTIYQCFSEKGSPIYYRAAGGRYFKVVTNYSTGSSAEKMLLFSSKLSNSIGGILSSNLSFWFYQIYSDNLNWKSYEIENFTIPYLSDKDIVALEKLYQKYLADIENNTRNKTVTEASSYHINEFKEYKIQKSKHIIDQIDDLICPLYGLTQEETDFIKNYEIEFRLSDND